ncbi:hypothetical protein DMB95_07935 [Campylobacter sp. MIT 12-8780]|uniref:hypothetical protein n=1 Tax=unclassified Campylobacter TaxID=2593542 RepID=UPI0010F96739|nr:MULTISPECIES: hypothetical protein [unclassified Campylobacter]NDJ27327.1 hypothetical protein [Campylobacter sp. MIT 19-121]TKX28435.1 hypothetical protein CQA38_07945 [Campylobacter sp. MIT 12-5580]TQR40346.1 hypothetical protein DMB95_07935 [Campylobacter sp. MIT 12-8780]
MSKPIQLEALETFKEELSAKKPELVLQVLSLLENLKAKAQDEKMVRISAELSAILNDEKNYEKIKSARDLNELLEFIEEMNEANIMLKIYPSESLRSSFPHLAQESFL